MNIRNKQKGVATLVVSLAILMLSTLVTFNVARAIVMEQRITNNDARSRQAFEAAEAGILAAMDYLQNNPDMNNDGVIDPVFNPDVNGLGQSNTANIGSGSVVVTTQDLSGGDMTSIRITSQGFSDDRTATRTITQILRTIDPLPNRPDNPVITRGAMILGGSADVLNPEGQSTIWSGSAIDLGSNNATTTRVPDVTSPTYPACMDVPMSCPLMDASNRQVAGVDIIANDASLASLSQDEFFMNFFGATPNTYRNSMATIDSSPANASNDANLATNEVIWVEGNASLSNVTVGCTVSVAGANSVCPNANIQPSILVINGDLNLTGNSQFYGIVYVTGNVSMTGTPRVFGSLVVGGDASQGGGNIRVTYNSNILAATGRSGGTAGSAGTWKDF